VVGELLLEQTQMGHNGKPVLRAELLSQQGDGLLPLMYHARVGRVRGKWLTVFGMEVIPKGTSFKSKVDTYRQTWWCLLDTNWPKVEDLPGQSGAHEGARYEH
jgi:hypothetical protein